MVSSISEKIEIFLCSLDFWVIQLVFLLEILHYILFFNSWNQNDFISNE